MADGKPGAPKGNKNAARGYAWYDALKRALKVYDKGGVPKGQALKRIADKVIELALEGDLGAVKEIGDRLDGKPAQTSYVAGQDGGPVVVSWQSGPPPRIRKKQDK